jgi:hypothetical protein
MNPKLIAYRFHTCVPHTYQKQKNNYYLAQNVQFSSTTAFFLHTAFYDTVLLVISSSYKKYEFCAKWGTWIQNANKQKYWKRYL